jgi:hypothetical protein
MHTLKHNVCVCVCVCVYTYIYIEHQQMGDLDLALKGTCSKSVFCY